MVCSDLGTQYLFAFVTGLGRFLLGALRCWWFCCAFGDCCSGFPHWVLVVPFCFGGLLWVLGFNDYGFLWVAWACVLSVLRVWDLIRAVLGADCGLGFWGVLQGLLVIPLWLGCFGLDLFSSTFRFVGS